MVNADDERYFKRISEHSQSDTWKNSPAAGVKRCMETILKDDETWFKHIPDILKCTRIITINEVEYAVKYHVYVNYPKEENVLLNEIHISTCRTDDFIIASKILFELNEASVTQALKESLDICPKLYDILYEESHKRNNRSKTQYEVTRENRKYMIDHIVR